MDDHSVTVHRGPNHRWWACACGWEGTPIPYGEPGGREAVTAIRHQTEANKEQQ